MDYVVFRTGGKQYKAWEGNTLEVERINVPQNQEITFDDVLLYVKGGSRFVGVPKLPHIKVVGKVLEHTKGEKIRVAKYKAKVRYRKVMGHRQHLSKVSIEKIVTEDKKKPATKRKMSA